MKATPTLFEFQRGQLNIICSKYMDSYPTKDIKLASILLALGVPYRHEDPVTHEIQDKDGREHHQYTFWFDVADAEKRKTCGHLVEAYMRAKGLFNASGDPAEYLLDKEHPLYWMMGVLANRETYMHWMRADAEPMRIYQEGNRTVLISSRASQDLKNKVKSQLQ